MPRVIPPVVDADDRYFWDGVQEHRLLLQQCACVRDVAAPAGPDVRHLPLDRLDDPDARGTGTVHSWVVSVHPAAPTEPGRIVVLVELTEGLRFVANLVDVDVADVRNEMAVVLCFREVDGVLLPQFRPADAADADGPA